jgi:hypothetical protein
VQLKPTAGSSATYARPLPLTIVIHNTPVPPDPGDAGNLTVPGIDSDSDKVRDDVQRWIILTYLDSQKKQLALDQGAIALQDALAARDTVSAQAAAAEERLAAGCYAYLYDDTLATNALAHVVLNTDLRRTAYKTYVNLSNTLSVPLDVSDLATFCNFDPNSFPN